LVIAYRIPHQALLDIYNLTRIKLAVWWQLAPPPDADYPFFISRFVFEQESWIIILFI
jgi:hypothetical protein